MVIFSVMSMDTMAAFRLARSGGGGGGASSGSMAPVHLVGAFDVRPNGAARKLRAGTR